MVPEPDTFSVVVSGALPAGSVSGAFSGALSVNGSASELLVAGTARALPERLELSLKIRYRDVPQDWVNRYRQADFDYRLRGRVAGSADVAWSGTKRWDGVSIEKREDVASGFVKLGAIRLTEFSLFESSGLAEVTVRNPLSFPLKLASTSYILMANGRQVGWGATDGRILKAEQTTSLALPIELDHGQLLAAAGSALRSGGQVEGRLQGTLVVRLAGTDVSIPIDQTGQFSVLQ